MCTLADFMKKKGSSALIIASDVRNKKRGFFILLTENQGTENGTLHSRAGF